MTSLSSRYILEGQKRTRGERKEDQLKIRKTDSVIQKGRRMLGEASG